MKTRKDLLEKKCTHSQYYSQFLTYAYIKNVVKFIGKEKILESTCENFNDIPLELWDKLGAPWGTFEKMREAGDYLTKSGIICISKEAARNYKFNQFEL